MWIKILLVKFLIVIYITTTMFLPLKIKTNREIDFKKGTKQFIWLTKSVLWDGMAFLKECASIGEDMIHVYIFMK